MSNGLGNESAPGRGQLPDGLADESKPDALDTGGPETQSRIILPSDLDFNSVMQQPLKIPTERAGSWFDIVRQEDHTQAIEAMLDLCSLAPADTIMRWAGGCKGFEDGMVDELFKFVAKGTISADGLRAFQGAVGSGGTMDFDDEGVESVMVCQIPYYMARLQECVAWGSTPQTFRMRLGEAAGNVIVSKYGAQLDQRGHMNMLTQDGFAGYQGWDGDVRFYMKALEAFAKRDYKVAVGVVNGGDVTMDEALLAMSKNVPVIIVEGTLRAADELVEAIRRGTVPDLYKTAFRERDTLIASEDRVPSAKDIARLTKIVNLKHPESLSQAMDELGLLT
jgi:hypothetical protein